jgi:hypothetical protein
LFLAAFASDKLFGYFLAVDMGTDGVFAYGFDAVLGAEPIDSGGVFLRVFG